MLSKKQGFLLRLTVARLLLVAVFVLLGFRLWYLQIVEGALFREMAEGNRRRTLPTLPLRGRIFDRNGRVLADNVPSFSLLAMSPDLPQDESERARMFDRLCTMLQCPGILQIDPRALDVAAKSRLALELAGPVRRPSYEIQDLLLAAQSPLSLTLRLDEAEAAKVRAVVSATAGLSYSNALEEALRLNAGPPYLPILLQENIPRDCALLLQEHHQDFPGIFVQAEPLRRYPTGETTAHIVGYIGRISPEELARVNPDPASGETQRYLANDRIGKMGAELAYEEILRGRLGLREIQVDAGGRPIGAPFYARPAEPGLDVILTLDTDLQEKVTTILEKYIALANAERPGYYRPVYSGVAIVMDPRNGQILAMVSLPTYDNNRFVQGMTAAEFRALIQDPTNPLLNRAISGQFPPGSTFKLVVAGAGLQEGVITPETRIVDRGALLVPNRYDPSLPPLVFPCWLRSGHGALNVVGGIQHSCNVFFFTVAGGTPEKQYEDGLGIERLERYAHAYGYGEPTGLGFPGESIGLIPNPKWKEEVLGEPWVQGDLYNMAIGQGNILATPLQVLNAAAAVANGGTRYRPQLLLRVVDSQGQVVQDFQPIVEQKLPVDPAYLALIRQGMRQAIVQGSNKAAREAIVSIAGKTGSAEFGPFLRKDTRQAHAWFVAFAPYEDPQLAVVVMVEGGGQGSKYALPAATEIIEYYFRRPGGPVQGGSADRP